MKKKELNEPALLTPTQTIALSKAVKEKEIDAARKLLVPGEASTDFVVRVIAKLTVGEPSETRETIPWKRIALHLLRQKPSLKGAMKDILKAIDSPEDKVFEASLTELAQPYMLMRPTSGRITGDVVAMPWEAK